MDYKNTLPWILIALLSTSAVAEECYIRSTTVSQANKNIERITDRDRTVVQLDGSRSKCVISFRAYISDKWYLAQGESVTETWGNLDKACAQAEQNARVNILETVSGTKLTANQEMMCTDKPLPREKASAKIGEIVWESEVTPHPIYRDNFRYRGSLCRWFVESRPKAGTVDMSQGIICQMDKSAWKVVDKW